MSAARGEVGVAERMELLELYGRLAFAIDSGDGRAWAALFTADGILRSRGREVVGRDAIARFADEWWAAAPDRRRHASWHHWFETDRDAVVGHCYAAVLRAGEHGPAAEFTAVYRDRFLRGGDGWLLAERDVAIDSSGQC